MRAPCAFGILVLATLPLLACSDKSLSSTGLQITVLGSKDMVPSYIALTLLSADTPVATKRLPETGTLVAPTLEQPLGVVLLDIDAAFAGSAKVIARGMTDGVRVSEAAVRTNVLAQTWHEVGLTLRPGALPDQDGDGLPDLVDDCPTDKTFRCGLTADGGIRAVPVADANIASDGAPPAGD